MPAHQFLSCATTVDVSVFVMGNLEASLLVGFGISTFGPSVSTLLLCCLLLVLLTIKFFTKFFMIIIFIVAAYEWNLLSKKKNYKTFLIFR